MDGQYQPAHNPHNHPGSHHDWAGPMPESAPATNGQQPISQPPMPPNPASPNDIHPRPVVQVLSTRGVEYFMMAVSLWFGAGALIWILLALLNGGANFTVLSFPVSLLLVTAPAFSFFFLRLKRAELAEPNLRLDPSKRRVTQLTQIVAFIICLFNVVGLLTYIMASIAGNATYPMWRAVLDTMVVLLVVGGILAYYWHDEHRAR